MSLLALASRRTNMKLYGSSVASLYISIIVSLPYAPDSSSHKTSISLWFLSRQTSMQRTFLRITVPTKLRHCVETIQVTLRCLPLQASVLSQLLRPQNTC